MGNYNHLTKKKKPLIIPFFEAEYRIPELGPEGDVILMTESLCPRNLSLYALDLKIFIC